MRRHLIVSLVALLALAVSHRSHAAGLLAPDDRTLPPLRVTEHSVNVTINDQIALTTLNQTFRNDTGRRLEATYVFPLPENADLTDFQMSFNGKMVQGEVLPAEKARAIYESIVRQSRDPGLIEFIGRRLLQMRVFPIEPNSDTKIQVQYQQICRPISGMSGYHYPLRTCKTMAGGGGQAYGTVRFAVQLHTQGALKNIWSPTHTVEIVRDGEHNAKIAYEASRGSLEDDFMLLYDTADGDLGMSAIAYKPHETEPGYFVLTLTPKQLWPQQEYQPQDVVFVMDTSGSMAGEKIDQAKAALKFCIDKLDDRDRFSIVRFSTGFDVFADSVTEAGKDKKAEARTWVEKFTAAGGTNINDALKAALDLRPKAADGRPFVVVFITDGQGNQPAEDTIKMVLNHAGSKGSRIFSFGVGHDVNTVLLDQLATQHSGKPTYVQPGENLELVLGDFFSVISQPVLTNLKLALPEIGATEKFPASLGDLYHGQQLIVAGRFERPASGAIKLSAMRDGKEVEFAWPNVSFNNTAEAKYVPAIWAGRKIAFLLDQIRAHGENDEMVREVIGLSTEFGIQTPYTSWLVNPEQRPMVEQLRRRQVPPGRPTSGGMGGGGGTGGGGRPAATEAAQRGALGAAGVDAEPSQGAMSPPVNASEADGFSGITADDLGAVAGEGATKMARRNAEMRESRARDKGRVDENTLAFRKIGEQWYNRVGRFWVDERIDEKTSITVVKFGSDAYFTLVERCPHLRSALATAKEIAVVVSDDHAVIVSENDGLEAFTPEQLQQAGLPVRTGQ
jgi:Ca-activated chloride channel family protein